MRKIFGLIEKINFYKDLGDFKNLRACKAELIKEILTYLEANFYEMDERNRLRLIYLLSYMPDQMRELVDMYRHIASSARKIVLLKILGQMPNSEYFSDLIKDYIDDTDSFVRATAVKILANVATDRDVVHIMKLLNDEDARVVSNTLEAINAVDYSSSRTIYFRYKNHSHNRVRATSLKLLWDAGHQDIYENIKEMIISNDERMVASAFWLLSQIDFPMDSILKIAERFSQVDSALIRISAIKTILKRKPELLKTFIADHFSPEEIKQAVEEIRRAN